MCGIFGIANHTDAATLAHLGLYALQHRGQESTGISSSDGDQVFTHKSMGHVADVYDEDALAKLKGYNAVGHTRYSTAGDSSKGNAQPIVVNCSFGTVAVCHNGNLINATSLRESLEHQGAIFQSTTDTEVILHLLARSQQTGILEGLAESLSQVQGAFSLLILTKDAMIGVRDPYGFRPLCLGKLNGSHVLASESCAFDLIDAQYVREIEPGEIIMIRGEQITSVKALHSTRTAKCVFEHVYFSRPDSMVFGRSVQSSRDRMGRTLARENPVEADLVVPIPDSGMAAAVGYAQESGIPFAMGLIRNHYVGRTFIEPTQSIRELGVRLKHNANRWAVDGKSIVLVDDSLVRGTTSVKIVRMMRQAAREVHFRIASPPITHPDFYGIDTPERDKLLAANHSVEEMRQIIGADSLAFLSVDGIYRAMGEEGRDPQRPQFTDHCFTGDYPTPLTDCADTAPRQLSLLAEAS
jgi:amidophosphoribosyltransferase